jgi:YVTN family beta-propeller protein
MYPTRPLLALAFFAAGLGGCHEGGTSASSSGSPPACTSPLGGSPEPVARHSSSIALSPDDKTLYVVNADSDTVSIIDTASRKLLQEIQLGSGPVMGPVVDGNPRYTPAVEPRYLALSPARGMLYVTGKHSSPGTLYGIDVATGKVTGTVQVGSEPAGVLVAPDESAIYVAVSQEAKVVEVDPCTMAVIATIPLSSPSPYPPKPWALGWSLDDKTLYVTDLLAPYVMSIDVASMAVSSINIPDYASRGDPRYANGTARGLYDVVARPGTSDALWVPHMMLANKPAQAMVGDLHPPLGTVLEFDTTAFPTLSVLADGAFVTRLSTNTTFTGAVPDNGQFGLDVVSGPQAVEFTPDGHYALMLDNASEDVMLVDADARQEAPNGLLHPLYASSPPGHMEQGLVLSSDGTTAYIDERNTRDVRVIQLDTSVLACPVLPGTPLTVDDPPIARSNNPDPMPAQYRAGQMVFFTSNQVLTPITQNNWIACSTCHVEGRSDAVTWLFTEGPRDTPSNAGGLLDTGFLLRTADRRAVEDYWRTIVTEMGGSDFSACDTETSTDACPASPMLATYLTEVASFVNYALPAPIPPTTDPTLVAAGEKLFTDPTVGCATCHNGPAHTDSGFGNPTLDLTAPVQCTTTLIGGAPAENTVLLHNVGTCNATAFPDVAHQDVPAPLGPMRTACCFDTPTLRGVSDSPPYLHDGSQTTLKGLLLASQMHTIKMGNLDGLSDADLDALVEYLKSL